MEKREKNRIKKKEETTEKDNDSETNNTCKSVSDIQSVKRSDEFKELRDKSYKKHCNWMKSNSDMYCPNKLRSLKTSYVYRKAFDRLKNYTADEPSASGLSKKCETSLRDITVPKKESKKEVALQKDDYYISLCQKRAEFRTHLIKKIKGSKKYDERHLKDETKIFIDYAREQIVLDNDVCGQTMAISNKSDTNIADTWITEEDKNLLRYYYYIFHEVDDIHAGSLDSDTLKKITGMVSTEWQERHNECMTRLIQEIKSDYITSMKKSIVDFTLQEPFEEAYSICAPPLRSRGIVEPFSPERNVKYQRIRTKLEKKPIILYHPCIRKTLDYWYREYGEMKQVDKRELISYGQPYDLSSFDYKFSSILRSTNDDLLKRWLPKICNILLASSKKGTLPLAKDTQYKKFFNCLAYIMENQLRDLCLRSMEDYINYLTDVGHTNCGFNIDVVVRNTSITFDPTFRTFVDALTMLLNSLYEAATTLPRAEVNLGLVSPDPHSPELLRPIISLDLLEQHANTISNLIQQHRIDPELQLHEFNKYMNLINDEDVNYVRNFLKAEPMFKKHCELIDYYDRLSKNIRFEFHQTSFTDLFKIRRHYIIEHIVSAAAELKNELVSKMVADYQQKARATGDAYQNIANQALSTPPNTSELMKLQAFIYKSETETVFELENRLREVMKHIIFLSDYIHLTPVELKNNNFAFHWYYKMAEIFEKHREIIASKTGEYQSSLKERIEKFEQDLQIYAKYCDELQYWGNVEELQRYKKKATSLDNKLVAAMDTIAEFNEEEKLFGWEISQYPLRKTIADKLSPYKKFYDIACDFITKHDMWTGAVVGTCDPEVIDNETGIAYRIVYKLEKMFQEPVIKKLAEIVRMKIEDFKENMPIILILGNPCLKSRHWEQVSEIVGFPIKVDQYMTLAKILDYGLGEYVAKFESISEAATKEGNLEKALFKMYSDWADIAFNVNPYRDTGTYVIASVDEIQLLLDDHLMKTQTMKNSLYIKPFEKETLEWEAKLLLLQDIMDYWLKVQATWMYLEPIFSSPDIQKQMPEESRRFSAVDKVCNHSNYSKYKLN